MAEPDALTRMLEKTKGKMTQLDPYLDKAWITWANVHALPALVRMVELAARCARNNGCRAITSSLNAIAAEVVGKNENGGGDG